MKPHTRLLLAICVLGVALAAAGCGARKTATKDSAKPAAKAASAGAESARSSDTAGKPKHAPDQAAQKDKKAGESGNPELDYLKSVLNLSGKAAPSELKPSSTKPAAVPPAQMKRPTAQQLLKAVQMVYASAQTARIESLSTTTMKQDGKTVGQAKDRKTTVLFKRPDKFMITVPMGTMCSDGKTVYNYISSAKRYQKTALKKEFLQAMAAGEPGVGTMGLLLGLDYARGVSSMKLLKDSKIGDKEVFVLSLDLKKGVAVPQEMDASQTLWVGKRDFAVYKSELVARMKPKAPEGYKGEVPKLIESTLTSRTTSFEPNVQLSDSAFAFKPPAGAKLLEKPKQVDLNGKHAPDFSFTWTDGSRKKLSEFRGKTVLLDFWALPLTEKHLPVLQKVYEQSTAGVQVITVNLNAEPDKVEEYLKEKSLTFPVVHLDEQTAESVMEQYGILGVPTILVIDADGIVRRAMIGPRTQEEIAAELQKAASG